MADPSILNDVIGPIMRGPSSSHTAGAYRIARIACDLAGETPRTVRVTFDPAGSYAPTCFALGVDKAFAAAIMGWDMTDSRYAQALEAAESAGIALVFDEEPLSLDDHPNAVRIRLECAEAPDLEVWAKSTGGGIIEYTRVGDRPARFDGRAWTTVIGCTREARASVASILNAGTVNDSDIDSALVVQTPARPDANSLREVRSSRGVDFALVAAPVLLAQPGSPTFASAADLLSQTTDSRTGARISELAIAYESKLLGLPASTCREEMARRVAVMLDSVARGLDDALVDMPLGSAVASRILDAEHQGRLPLGGPLTRAGARAMACMHTCNSKGVVCAAPTGGSAGVVAGVFATMNEEMGVSTDRLVDAAFVAGAVGLIMARRATFAAEEAGCQVEIGFAGAMAAAAIVETFGGTAAEALDAAAVSLQNTSGIVCDTVGGGCEIPCQTRNASAASGAFLTADLVMGGYRNPIPLDESIDASYEAGTAIPSALRCTSRGGLAITRAAQALVSASRRSSTER